MEALSAYARACGISLREGNLFGWMSDPAVVTEAVRGLFTDAGHLCDRDCMDFLALAAPALGLGPYDLTLERCDGKAVPREDLLPKLPATTSDGARNDDYADCAEAAVEVYGRDEAAVSDALRDVAVLARAKGVDVLGAALAGVGAWSAERRDPNATRPDLAAAVGRGGVAT